MKKLTPITIALLLFAASASAQMVMEWQSSAGVQAATSIYMGVVFKLPGRARLDFDGDGFRDIPVFNKLGGHEQFFKVISGKDPNMTWQFPLTGVNFVKGQTRLIGFFDVDNGNGNEKEVIVANRIQTGGRNDHFQATAIFNHGGLIVQYKESDLLLGIADYDNDNELEILIGDISARRLQLWGKGN